MKQDNYYEQLRTRLKKWAKSKDGRESKWVQYVLLLPDLGYLLVALILDPEIPAKHKAKLGMVIAYLISPFDLLPEGVIGPAGYIEDLALIAYTVNQLLNHVDEGIVLRHWKGEGDLLQVIRHLVEVADEMVGSGLWAKIKKMISAR
jgi:uncharacterized membrane protein YkvA (DUF1232 family)